MRGTHARFAELGEARLRPACRRARRRQGVAWRGRNVSPPARRPAL